MTETLGQQYSQLADEMKKSPKTYFREQALDMLPGEHRVDGLFLRDYTIYKDGGMYVRPDLDHPFAWVSISTDSSKLCIGANRSSARAQVQLRYRFDDETGLGFAESVHLYSTQNNMCSDHKDLNCDTIRHEFVVEPEAYFIDCHSHLTAVFESAAPALTHANITVTTTPADSPSTEWAAFTELPVRSVTIQMLYDWMQRTFSGQLKPLNLEKTERYAKLGEKYASVFSAYNPTDSTLDFVESYKAKGWELIAVNSIQSLAAQYNHAALIRNRGAENVFHYQQDAMLGRNLVGVNLYFVKK